MTNWAALRVVWLLIAAGQTGAAIVNAVRGDWIVTPINVAGILVEAAIYRMWLRPEMAAIRQQEREHEAAVRQARIAELEKELGFR